MVKRWTFLDYVSPSGENLIYTWLNERPKKAKARINTRLLYFEALDRINEPHAKTLEGAEPVNRFETRGAGNY